jgi:uncharacterized protein (TIGR02246 family)
MSISPNPEPAAPASSLSIPVGPRPSVLRPNPAAAQSKLEQPILQVLEAYRAAVWAKDVDAFVSLYDEQVCVFDLWGKWAYRGRDAWRGMVAGWFGLLGAERVAVSMEQVYIIGAPDLATVHAFVTYAAISPEGKKLRALRNRLTCSLQRQDDAWRIVHEHTSVPVDGETTRAILQ